MSSSRRWPHLGSGVELVWIGGERTWAGTATFDLSAVPLSGGTQQLVCLSANERAPVPIFCVQIVPSPCPPFGIGSFFRTLDAALLTIPVAVAPGQAGPLPPAGEPPKDPPRKRRKCRKKPRGAALAAGVRRCVKKPGVKRLPNTGARAR